MALYHRPSSHRSTAGSTAATTTAAASDAFFDIETLASRLSCLQLNAIVHPNQAQDPTYLEKLDRALDEIVDAKNAVKKQPKTHRRRRRSKGRSRGNGHTSAPQTPTKNEKAHSSSCRQKATKKQSSSGVQKLKRRTPSKRKPRRDASNDTTMRGAR